MELVHVIMTKISIKHMVRSVIKPDMFQITIVETASWAFYLDIKPLACDIMTISLVLSYNMYISLNYQYVKNSRERICIFMYYDI